MNDPSSREEDSLDLLVGQVADEFLRRQEAGERPGVEEYVARHPQAAGLLRKVLASLQALDAPLKARPDAAAAPSAAEEGGTLGDFRIVREVGRGGMGIVYEAEQISLRRRVALKVLPFAATMDSRQLQRFHNEARAAASLEHPHIVPVYGVGCERAVHFYAMKFIDGQTLAQLIARRDAAVGEATVPHAQGAGETPRPAATVAVRDAAYFRRVAEWGVQAAEALEHAHSLGIVHRDVKPGNLMIDGSGKLWVTDFGLARTASEGNLTMTGDVLGTLRYMSPEQALAKHGLVDHRTDVYGLGVTLYELLTGRPAFEGADRQELLLRIAADDPPAPRTLDRSIPVDLETVMRKAIEKEGPRRYASAQELADDLQRFLERRPIQARRPSALDRLGKWAGRHRGAVAAAFAVLLLAVVGLSVAVVLVKRERDGKVAALGQRDDALTEARNNLTEAQTQKQKAANNQRKAEEHLTDALALVQQTDASAVFLKQGLHRQAANHARQLLNVREKLLATYPEKVEYNRDFVSSCESLARLLRTIGESQEEVEVWLKFFRTSRRLGEDKTLSDDPLLSEALAPTRQGLAKMSVADALRAVGKHDLAVAAYGEAITQWEKPVVYKVPLNEDMTPEMRALVKLQAPRARALQMTATRSHEALTRAELGITYEELGQVDQAEKQYLQALDLWSKVAAGPDSEFASDMGWGYAMLGNLHFRNGKKEQASKAYQSAVAFWAKNAPDERERVRFLADCPDPRFHDTKLALELAQKRAQRSPNDLADWRILGLAQYREGQYEDAWGSIYDKIGQLQGRRMAPDAFLLAMVLHRLGNPKTLKGKKVSSTAKSMFDAGIRFMSGGNPKAPKAFGNPKDLEALRARAEAAKLIGIRDGETDKP